MDGVSKLQMLRNLRKTGKKSDELLGFETQGSHSYTRRNIELMEYGMNELSGKHFASPGQIRYFQSPD